MQAEPMGLAWCVAYFLVCCVDQIYLKMHVNRVKVGSLHLIALRSGVHLFINKYVWFCCVDRSSNNNKKRRNKHTDDHVWAGVPQ